ncbi:acyl-CoA thioesterase [Arthrobacter crystallopoietes]|uniref:acyl-CoA thioesterase n=1 Tax=Crystallibacter crystallopoietes TaxID=37928 RepID=UPI00111101A8|nr:thioesterase family protein [Arthrobacter crystallopoietes]
MPNAFRFPLQLRFSDIDSYAHVNNVAFLSYLETARVRLHESPSGISTNDGGQPSVRELAGAENFTLVGRQEIEYLAPLLFRPEPVYVSVWVAGIGRSSFELGYVVSEEDESKTFAVGATTMVLVNRDSGRSVALPGQYRAALERRRGPEVPFRRRASQCVGKETT